MKNWPRALYRRTLAAVQNRILLMADASAATPAARWLHYGSLLVGSLMIVAGLALGRAPGLWGLGAALYIQGGIGLLLVERILIAAAGVPFASSVARKGAVARHPILVLLIASLMHLTTAFAPEVTILVRAQPHLALAVLAGLCVLFAALPMWVGLLFIGDWWRARR